MNLMLLCAGEGTRLRPHTYLRPKPAIPFLGVPLAAYSLEWCHELTLDRLVVNTHHLGSQIRQLFQQINHGAGELFFSDEQSQLLGTGGGIQKAGSWLTSQDEFFLMNGDEVFLPSQEGFLREALRLHREQNRLATLFVMDHPGVGQQFGGVWTDPQGRILGFGKTPTTGSSKGWHYIGAAIFSKRILSFLPPGQASNILYDGLARALEQKESAAIFQVDGWWRETGNEKDFLEATRSALDVLQNGPAVQKKFLESVLDRHAHGWNFTSHPVPLLKLAGSVIESGAQIQEFGVIGASSRIESGCQLKHIVVADNIVLEPSKGPRAGIILS